MVKAATHEVCTGRGCQEPATFRGYCKMCWNDWETACEAASEKRVLQRGAGKAVGRGSTITAAIGKRQKQQQKSEAKEKKKQERADTRKSAKAEQRREAVKEKMKEKTNGQGVYLEDTLDDDNTGFDSMWSMFSSQHASKTIDSMALARQVEHVHLVTTEPAPTGASLPLCDAWLKSSSLACPCCGSSLRRTIRTQGRGGWHAVLMHLRKCRATMRSTTSTPEQIDAMDAAIQAAWGEAQSALNAALARKARATEQRQEEKKLKDSSDEAPKPEVVWVPCAMCGTRFRDTDKASLERHRTACREKQANRKRQLEEAVEATTAKLQEAQASTQRTQEALASARLNLKDARIRGMQIAKQQKEETKRRQRQAKKGCSKPAKKSEEEQATHEGPTTKAMEKAQREVKLAERKLEAAQKKENERKDVAEACAKRATEQQELRTELREASAQEMRHTHTQRMHAEAKLKEGPRAKRGGGEVDPKQKKKGAKKESKATKAANAKEKTEAKKQRRHGPTAEGLQHEGFNSEFHTTSRGRAALASMDDY